MILPTIIVLGVLIFVHELGHFWAAKAVGIRVERFSIGLGPRLVGFTRGETEYVLSAIPLGGYVKMGGMDDEVMERVEGGDAARPREPSPRDYDAKPVWARAIVISAGVVMNMLFAFVAYSAVNAFWGRPTIETTRVEAVDAALLPPGAEALAGIPEGARLVRIGGEEVANWSQVERAFLEGVAGPLAVVLADPALEVEVIRPESREARERIARSLTYWTDPVVGSVESGSPAAEGGVEAGDRVLAVNEVPVRHWSSMTEVIRRHPGEQVSFRLERNGGELTRNVVPAAVVEEDPVTGERLEVGRVGIAPDLAGRFTYEPVPPGEAVAAGWRETEGATRLILGFLRDLVTGGVSARSVGSIVTIGQASGQAAQMGVEVFLRFMALFSVNLAILNLLPIPVLDGGHLVFLGIEAVRGRALSAEQRLRWSNVGFLVIMGIMIWALGNDLLRLFGL
ncbi:MAG: RIP metalloprotease RseP [Longimicrobiales bacterium]|nr:RIP metalloprotease RseP [Longimicrobiales bacterium]